MTRVYQVMTSNVATVQPGDTIIEAAQKMQDNDVGALPVCDGNCVLGLITDRDIVIRVLARGGDVMATTVEMAMTTPVVTCTEDEDIRSVARCMEDKQIRRMIVLDFEGRLCGIISLGDIAVRCNKDRLTGETLEKICEDQRKVA